MYRVDVQVGKLDTIVGDGDRRVVPVGDRVGEDAGDDLGGEVQCRVDRWEVVWDGDWRDVMRQVDSTLVADPTLLRGFEFLVLQCGIRAGEVRTPGEEQLTAATGTNSVVFDGGVGVEALEASLPTLHACSLG